MISTTGTRFPRAMHEPPVDNLINYVSFSAIWVAINITNGNLYLASDESKFVTGEELIIDGGWSSK
ncbi:hypothetical protein [Peribacillus sp. NPDC097295]|uniref:hypothetical protein n=1 Tax=Peribacillus sp. NPDC097295 TaxID=3364402 RepID=UPI00380EBE74